mmetsp:Transcript_31158/g.41219  ORF Transcript_31158/g.41219 Transcript_31158/m.41219 type:complete len:459 (+) Transcript_31158:44-1420(+)
MESDEEYDFEYSEEEEEEEDADLQNIYYNAKGLKDEDGEQAIKEFARVVTTEQESGEKGEWGFKALKQQVKLLFHAGPSRYPEMMERYQDLLTYTKEHVTQNRSEKGINGILDYVSSSMNWELLSFIYETTLIALQQSKNERLFFKTNLKLGHLLFHTGDLSRLQKVIKELLRSCGGEVDNEDDFTADSTNLHQRGTQLQEVYALQIQMYSEQQDNKKLRELYKKALRVKSGLPHPRTLAVILECGGKMHMREREWEPACTAFFQAFKSYDEAGEPRRLRCLQYLVLASMLQEADVDPFASQEARPYKNHPEIQAMTNLVTAFSDDNIKEFEKILKLHGSSLMSDPFVRNYIDDLLRTIRTQVLIKVITPYTKISLEYLSRELNGISIKEVESLLVYLVLDNKIQGKIDQVKGIFVRNKIAKPGSTASSLEEEKSVAFGKWSDALKTLQDKISCKVTY